MVGTDHLHSVPPVKDRVGSTERDGAITVKPGKETLSEGRGEYFSLDRSPLMDGHYPEDLETKYFYPTLYLHTQTGPVSLKYSGAP
jgi:hypothetical protein